MKKPYMEKARRKIFPVCLTEKEKEKIKELADAEGLCLAEFIRLKSLGRL